MCLWLWLWLWLPHFEQHPGITGAARIKNLADFDEANFGKSSPSRSISQCGLRVDADNIGHAEQVAGQNSNGVRPIALSPACLLAEPQADFDPAHAIVNIKIRYSTDRNALFVFDNKPELASVAIDVIALKGRKKFGHRARVWTMRIIAPHLVVPLPVKDAPGIAHSRTTQVDTVAMKQQVIILPLFSFVFPLCISHTIPHCTCKAGSGSRCSHPYQFYQIRKEQSCEIRLGAQPPERRYA